MTRDEVLAFADQGFFSERAFTEAWGLVEVRDSTATCMRRLLGEAHVGWSEDGPSCECGRRSDE